MKIVTSKNIETATQSIKKGQVTEIDPDDLAKFQALDPELTEYKPAPKTATAKQPKKETATTRRSKK